MSPNMSPLICVEQADSCPPQCPLIRLCCHCPCSGPTVSLVGLLWVPTRALELWPLSPPGHSPRSFPSSLPRTQISPSCLKTPPLPSVVRITHKPLAQLALSFWTWFLWGVILPACSPVTPTRILGPLESPLCFLCPCLVWLGL